MTVMEYWQDAQADKFANRDLKDIDTVMDHLVSQLQESSEFIGKLDQQLKDELE